MSNRWPLHPPPCPNESLSSWITRIANVYDMYLEEFLKNEFDISYESYSSYDLNFDPPLSLLTNLSERTGVTFDDVRALTAQAYTPLLIDALKIEETSSSNDYVNQFCIFPGKRKKFIMANKNWVPWLSIKRSATVQCCRLCISEDSEPYLRLHWSFSWMITCPKHKILLEQALFHGITSKNRGFYFVTKDTTTPYPLDDLYAMDNITLQAVTTGLVEVPSGILHGGVWIRILRSLIEELNSSVNIVGQKNRRLMILFWQKLNLSVRQDFGRYVLFEKCDHNIKLILMLVASLVIKAIFSKQIKFSSSVVNLLTSPVIYDHDFHTVYPGLIRKNRLSKEEEREIAYVQAFKDLKRRSDELIAAMHSNPEAVISFRNMMRAFDSEGMPKIDESLKKLGIKII